MQGTINGYGERTGNCNLTSVILNLHFKLKKSCVPAESLAGLTELSQFVDKTTNLRPNVRLPWVRGVLFRDTRLRGGLSSVIDARLTPFVPLRRTCASVSSA